jgi:hypothetical protein
MGGALNVAGNVEKSLEPGQYFWEHRVLAERLK